MCGPMLGMVTGIMSSVAEFGAAQQDYKAKSAAWKENYVNALAAGRDEQTELQQRELQEEMAVQNKLHLSMLEEAEAKGSGEVMAAGAGQSGLSVDSMLREIGSQAAFNRTTEETNWQFTAQELQTKKKASVQGIKDRIASVQRPSSPSPLGMIIGIAGAGAKAFGSM